MIEKIQHEEELLAIIIYSNYEKRGISFITPNDFSLQLGYMTHPEKYDIKPHLHHPVERKTVGTQEVLIIKSGSVRVDFYTYDKEYLESREINKGDVILLISGGHGFTTLKPTTMIEVKNGPYVPEKDKEKFDGIINNLKKE